MSEEKLPASILSAVVSAINKQLNQAAAAMETPTEVVIDESTWQQMKSEYLSLCHYPSEIYGTKILGLAVLIDPSRHPRVEVR